MQRSQEKDQPGIPVWFSVLPGGLRLPQGQIVGFLVMLYQAFQRTIWRIGVSCPQQQQQGEGSGQAAIAIGKRVDGQEDGHEDAHPQERMQAGVLLRASMPIQQRFHVQRGVEMAGCLEDDADLFPVRVERCHEVRMGFPFASVPMASSTLKANSTPCPPNSERNPQAHMATKYTKQTAFPSVPSLLCALCSLFLNPVGASVPHPSKQGGFHMDSDGAPNLIFHISEFLLHNFPHSPWQAIRGWIPADLDESPVCDTMELWDQSPDACADQAFKAPEIDLGDGRILVLESA